MKLIKKVSSASASPAASPAVKAGGEKRFLEVAEKPAATGTANAAADQPATKKIRLVLECETSHFTDFGGFTAGDIDPDKEVDPKAEPVDEKENKKPIETVKPVAPTKTTPPKPEDLLPPDNTVTTKPATETKTNNVPKAGVAGGEAGKGTNTKVNTDG